MLGSTSYASDGGVYPVVDRAGGLLVSKRLIGAVLVALLLVIVASAVTQAKGLPRPCLDSTAVWAERDLNYYFIDLTFTAESLILPRVA